MTDPLRALVALRDKSPRIVLGLNSGTSADGIDAVLVALRDDARPEVLAFSHTPYPDALAGRVRGAAAANAADLADLDVAVGHAFAEAAAALVARTGIAVDLVGSHGQTVFHQPRRASLQIGQAAVIAERLAVPVISDFRTRDVAAGGEGAPLVPLADWILFAPATGYRALQNIGGIANVTVVGAAREDTLAFDTGPGNMPLDGAARLLLGRPWDEDGATAARGTADDALVAELLRHPFFAQPPPRSTGRETFGDAWLVPLLGRFDGRPADLFATLTRFVAASIADAYRRFVTPRTGALPVFVSGGGAHNRTLLAELERALAPSTIGSITSLGLDPDAKEAVAFALLAHETLFCRAGNLPAATGARGPRILGKVTL
jgi:anhydro-N-acetylmuramic acid kinase